jgi:hypothetical protein
MVGWVGLSLLYTQKYLKIAEVHTTAWYFDNEGLVKINFCVKGHEKSLNAAFYNLKKFKNIFIINRDITL